MPLRDITNVAKRRAARDDDTSLREATNSTVPLSTASLEDPNTPTENVETSASPESTVMVIADAAEVIILFVLRGLNHLKLLEKMRS